jgi:hypothetical protein
MATTNSRQGEGCASKESVSRNRLLGKTRAGGFEATSSAEKWGDQTSVEPENGTQEPNSDRFRRRGLVAIRIGLIYQTGIPDRHFLRQDMHDSPGDLERDDFGWAARITTPSHRSDSTH